MNILIINLFAGLLTIAVAFLVIHVWLPHTKAGKHGPHHLLLWGITIGFVAIIGDNIYWGLTWLSRLNQWPSEPAWFTGGPWANLLFRHGGKIAAAALHLEAARRAGIIGSRELFEITSFAIVASAAFFFLLLLGT